jgi:hypothetical protein
MCEKKNDAAEARHVTGQIVEVHYVPHCSVCVCVCVCVCVMMRPRTLQRVCCCEAHREKFG